MYLRFNLLHLVLTLLALLESVFIHVLIRYGRKSLTVQLDRVFRIVLPFIIYPLCVGGLFVWALGSSGVGVALICCGILLPVILGAASAIHVHARNQDNKMACAKQLARAADTELDDEAAEPLVRTAFEALDDEGLGELHENDMRSLLHAMYPGIPHNQRRQLLDLVPTNLKKLTYDDFDGTILAWRARRLPHHKPRRLLFWTRQVQTRCQTPHPPLWQVRLQQRTIHKAPGSKREESKLRKHIAGTPAGLAALRRALYPRQQTLKRSDTE